MPHKVLFFDSWKGGIKSFLRLIPSFNENDISSRLIHLGSWGNEDVLIKDENIQGLSVRDISYYKNKNLLDILKEEKPDLVIFLSTHTFAHRAFIRYCQFLNIPTINLFHGYVRVQDVENVKGAYKIKIGAYLLFVLKRLPKLIYKTLPTYIRSLIKTKAKKSDWISFVKNLSKIVSPAKFKVGADAKSDYCLIFAKGDVKHAIDTYGFAPSKIIDVGNPDLIDFGFKIELLKSFDIKKSINNEFVMYIDTALVASGLVVNGKSEYLQQLLDTNKSLQNQGKKLLFRPHPETTRVMDLSLLKNQGIIIVDKNDFIDKLKLSCAVIAEPTTLSIIPALMGIPLFFAKYNKLNELSYGEVLTSYPLGNILNDIDEISIYLNEFLDKDLTVELDEWISYNSGPMPAEKMPERVTSIALNIINKIM
jgi:hypothetical protein